MTTPTPASRLLSRLQDVKQTGSRTHRARCPACGVGGALLVFEVQPGGSLGLECLSRRRCRTLAVLTALRLDVPALFDAEAGELVGRA